MPPMGEGTMPPMGESGPCEGGPPVCADMSNPTCEDGTAQPPCAEGEPVCSDQSTPACDSATSAPSSPSLTSCDPYEGTCATDGTSNYNSRELTYDGATGKLSGTITTNLCVSHQVSYPTGGTVSCVEQVIPENQYAVAPNAIATLGRVGLSLKSGLNIYSAYEAGFGGGGNQPYPCNNGTGYGECAGGLTVVECEAHLQATCEGEDIQYGLFLDDCGGHADPYHFHADLACDYSVTDTHSAATGVGLDGTVIYGKYESGTTIPTDLDACNGHVGTVPAHATYGITSSSVYHYHMTDAFPHTIGCFGPVASQEACSALYSTCGDGTVSTSVVADRSITTWDIDLYCPCVDASASSASSPTIAPTTAPTQATVVPPTSQVPTSPGVIPTSAAPTPATPTSQAPTQTAVTPTMAVTSTSAPTSKSPTQAPTQAPTTVTPTSAPTSASVAVAFESTFADLTITSLAERDTFESDYKADIASQYSSSGITADDVIITEVVYGSVMVKSKVLFNTVEESSTFEQDAKDGNLFSTSFSETKGYGTPIISSIVTITPAPTTVSPPLNTTTSAGTKPFISLLLFSALIARFAIFAEM
eukprot:CAMPEP_0196598704 /NCGR_PEP_ID=MMETSP1081-20130531/94463_1 /TAXON_ID=36882 /ORGANISM="Pyramimonas amylifera, Strain CCMP720" /LENGTH=588 /DNA_ID=CAMNT_0041924421 /DNA_START=59 /DNA_END=1825 /DNA_ORIENTATION=+